MTGQTLCSGCGVCAGICPKDAIRMELTSKGEYRAVRKIDGCRECGLCLRTCPFVFDRGHAMQIYSDLYREDSSEYDPVAGFVKASYIGSVADEQDREKSASGGLATWLTVELLRRGVVDAVWMPGPTGGNSPLFAYRKCETADQVKECAGSAYYPVHLADALQSIRKTPGRFAVVLLPCMAKGLRAAMAEMPALKRKIPVVLGLVCGQQKSVFFTEQIVAKAKVAFEDLVSVEYRSKQAGRACKDYWPEIVYSKSGKTISTVVGLEPGMFMDRSGSLKACAHCFDVFPDGADAAFMDAWMEPYSSYWLGSSIVTVRTSLVQQIFLDGRKRMELHLETVDTQTVLAAQATPVRDKHLINPCRSATPSPLENDPELAKKFPKLETLEKLYWRLGYWAERKGAWAWLKTRPDYERFKRILFLLKLPRKAVKATMKLSALARAAAMANGGKRPGSRDVKKTILQIHSTGDNNVGDDAQLFSAHRRLEKAGYRVVVGISNPTDDRVFTGSLGEHAPMPNLYIRRPLPFWAKTIHLFAKAVKIRGAGVALQLVFFFARAQVLLAAARVSKAVGFVPLLDRQARKAVESIRSCDAVCFTGGGTHNDLWVALEVLPRCTVGRLSRVFGKPLFLTGQQIGPIGYGITKWLMRWGYGHAKLISARDSGESARLLESMGFPKERLCSMGDETFDLDAASVGRGEEILRNEGVEPGEKILAVHVRLTNFSEEFADQAPKMAGLLDRIVERFGVRILFFPVSRSRTSKASKDTADSFEVFAHMKNKGACHFLCREIYSPPDAKAVAGRCCALLGFSLHAWIFAMTSGRPAFGLYRGEYFGQKARGIFSLFRREQWAWDFDEFDMESVLGEMEHAFENKEKHRRELLALTENLAGKVSIPLQSLNEVLRRA